MTLETPWNGSALPGDAFAEAWGVTKFDCCASPLFRRITRGLYEVAGR